MKSNVAIFLFCISIPTANIYAAHSILTSFRTIVDDRNVDVKIESSEEVSKEFKDNKALSDTFIKSFNSAISFLQMYIPANMVDDDYKIKVKIIDQYKEDTIMSVSPATGIVTLSWPRFKKIFSLAGVSVDEKKFGVQFFESLIVHELTHKIHYRAYQDNNGNWNPVINLAQNKELREYIAIVAECYYLIKSLGLNWFYQNYASEYLNGRAQSVPPMGVSIIGKNYESKQTERRWAIFAAAIYLSECWGYDSVLKKVLIPWNRKEMLACLDAKNNSLGNLPKEWLSSSLKSTEFVPFTLAGRDITSISQWNIYAQIILTDIIAQARKVIKSQLYSLPIEEFMENQIYEDAGEVDLEKDEYYKYLEGWFLIKFHHFGGGYSEEKVKMFKIEE